VLPNAGEHHQTGTVILSGREPWCFSWIPCINGGSVNVICEAASYGSNSFQIIGYTPLPSTWTMLIVGYFGLGFFAYRGSKKKAAAIAAA
jgi:hypothetical protein